MIVYADHPFKLIPTPEFQGIKNSEDYVVSITQQRSDILQLLLKTSQPDMYDRVASGMAVAHCMIIRGLNSVYLQAPHIQSRDQEAFVQYALRWCWEIEVHHDGEENGFFPAVEELTGEPGVMDANVKQHAVFHDGVAVLHTYLKEVLDGKEKYDGLRIISLIDSFGEALAQHLSDEIPTLQNLRRFGDEKMATFEQRMNELDANNIVRNLRTVTLKRYCS